jgi:putative DNA primase/helicase
VAFAHDPRDRITRMAPVDYDPARGAAVGRQAGLLAAGPGDAGYLQRLAGYALTGFTHEQVFVIHQGKGRDGKSTFMNALRELAATMATWPTCAPSWTPASGAAGRPRPTWRGWPATAGCCRGRAAARGQAERGDDQELHRRRADRGAAAAAGPVQFTPKPKVFMEANSRPVIRGDDEGIWRRIRLVLWEHQLAKARWTRACRRSCGPRPRGSSTG